ncbi:SAM-dependent methyltransferase [Nocardia sp. NPDC051750]|uniref:SAM-dependent methyltransferase n=1 Tax=Nocardia sp. NPDC051750 TaxID=3364325 RepID=UPI00378E03B4
MPPNASDASGSSPRDVPAPTGVGRTALMVAAARAAESRRDDRLFTDPYAADFVAAGGVDFFTGDPAPPEGAADRASGSFADYAPIRTRFFDDYLRATAGTIRQVVIVAAGLDTRAFRLGLAAETTVYELDSAEVLTFKQGVLDRRGAQPTGRRVPVPTDLRGPWDGALAEAGFDPEIPAAWLIEGLLPYLEPEQNDRLLTAVTAQSAAGSRLAIEFLHVDAVALMTQALAGADAGEMTSLWTRGGVDEDPDSWLRRHGWDPEPFDVYERARSYHRDLPPLGDTPVDRFAEAARNSLIIARRS